MKNLSAGVRVAVLFMLLAIGAYIVWKNLGQNPAGSSNQELYANFQDASGLPKKSKVVVAGLPQGEVIDLEVVGRYAKVTFKLSNDVPVWSNAVVFKKATSLLGENYLEIDPGSPEAIGPDGKKATFTPLGSANIKENKDEHVTAHPPCPDYNSSDERKKDACRRVVAVVEATTPDKLLHRIEETMPNVDAVLASVRDLSEELRGVVKGPLTNVANRIDGLVQKEAGTVADIIERADRSMKKIDQITDDLKAISADASPRVKELLKNLDEASADAKDVIAVAKDELKQTGDKLRGKLDKLDGVIDSTQSIAKKIDDSNGTLSQLVNKPDIADNVEQITDDAKGFLGTLFNIKAYVGLRSEYNFRAGFLRSYVSVELHTRPDKFYLIELEKGPRGNYPDVSLVFDPTVDPNHWVRKSEIKDEVRFTFQFAKRIDWLTLRYGIKESTGGIGADFDLPWWGKGLRFTADIFDATFDKYPRVKLTAAYELFRHIYVLGGVDELLNKPQTLQIVKGTSDVPIQFDTFRYGRDFFAGAMLKFNDEDLSALLTVGGSALGAATK